MSQDHFRGGEGEAYIGAAWLAGTITISVRVDDEGNSQS